MVLLETIFKNNLRCLRYFRSLTIYRRWNHHTQELNSIYTYKFILKSVGYWIFNFRFVGSLLDKRRIDSGIILYFDAYFTQYCIHWLNNLRKLELALIILYIISPIINTVHNQW